MQFPVPNPPRVQLFRMQDFLGVDFSSAPASVADGRSPDAYNFTHENGQNVKRSGYDLIASLVSAGGAPLGAVNGLFALGDILIIHVGKHLYMWNGTGVSVLIDGAASPPVAVMADAPSFFLNFNGDALIFDGDHAWIVKKDGSNYTASTLSDAAYTPTTSINRDYDGDPTTPFEKVNLLTPRRINSFKGSSARTSYQLDVSPIDAAEVTAETLNGDGTWTLWEQGTGAGTISVDYTAGVVTFYSAPGLTPIGAEDNIKIKFSKTTSDFVSRINKCTFAASFGANGNNNRVFASGNTDYPNTDWYCDMYNVTYWPDTNYSQVGAPSSAILGYTRVGNAQMAIHKQTDTGDQGVYYRTGEYSEEFSDDIFPVRAGYTDVEMLSMRTTAMLEGEPIFLSRLGVHAMIPRNTLTHIDYTLPNRSFYVNNRLTQEPNLEDACAVTLGNKYYLAVNGHVYVADGEYKYYNVKTGKRSAQYEWYYWIDVPAVCICAFKDNLYFGDAAGNVCRFVDGQYWDYDTNYESNQRPVSLYWTCPLRAMNTISLRKTIRHTVAIAQPYSTSKCIIGYVVDGEKRPMRENEISVFDFGDIDFGDITFSGGTAARAIVSKKNIRKFNFVQLYFEAPEDTPAGLYAIEIQYTLAGKVRR